MDPNVEHGQGPSSLESEYDDYLAFSDVDLGSPTGENAERVTGKLTISTLIYLIYLWFKLMLNLYALFVIRTNTFCTICDSS